MWHIIIHEVKHLLDIFAYKKGNEQDNIMLEKSAYSSALRFSRSSVETFLLILQENNTTRFTPNTKAMRTIIEFAESELNISEGLIADQLSILIETGQRDKAEALARDLAEKFYNSSVGTKYPYTLTEYGHFPGQRPGVMRSRG